MKEPREPLPVREGDVLAGKYRVERVLGSGGMGVVVAAKHLALGERVALKVLLREAMNKPDVAPRFLREARTALCIRSEHVAHVLDVGELEDGLPYLVMEHLEGADLRQLLRVRRSFSPADAIEVGLHVADALAEAHAQGVVHRDLKPSNLFLTERADGRPLVKVLDFGIAKSVHELGDGHETQTDTFIGSPRYAAPEQLRSAKNVDARADLWSLGVVLYELVAGVRPFEAESAVAVIATIMADEAPPLREHVPDVDPALEAAIARCLERDPARRFQSVREVAQALAAVPLDRQGALVDLCHLARQRAAAMAAAEPGAHGTRATAVEAHADAAPAEEAHAATEARPKLPAASALAAAAALAARVGPAPADKTSFAVLDSTPAPQAIVPPEAAPPAAPAAEPPEPSPVASPAPRPTVEADATPAGVSRAGAPPSDPPRRARALTAVVLAAALLAGAALAPRVLGSRYTPEPHDEAIPKAGAAPSGSAPVTPASEVPPASSVAPAPPAASAAAPPSSSPPGASTPPVAPLGVAPRAPVSSGLRPRAPGGKVDPGEQRKW
jgi:serine/threonine-protein kinase